MICVRHPATIGMLRQAFASMNTGTGVRGVE
jgi:hypothetical protein